MLSSNWVSLKRSFLDLSTYEGTYKQGFCQGNGLIYVPMYRVTGHLSVCVDESRIPQTRYLATWLAWKCITTFRIVIDILVPCYCKVSEIVIAFYACLLGTLPTWNVNLTRNMNDNFQYLFYLSCANALLLNSLTRLSLIYIWNILIWVYIKLCCYQHLSIPLGCCNALSLWMIACIRGD